MTLHELTVLNRQRLALTGFLALLSLGPPVMVNLQSLIDGTSGDSDTSSSTLVCVVDTVSVTSRRNNPVTADLHGLELRRRLGVVKLADIENVESPEGEEHQVVVADLKADTSVLQLYNERSNLGAPSEGCGIVWEDHKPGAHFAEQMFAGNLDSSGQLKRTLPHLLVAHHKLGVCDEKLANLTGDWPRRGSCHNCRRGNKLLDATYEVISTDVQVRVRGAAETIMGSVSGQRTAVESLAAVALADEDSGID